MLTRPVTRPVVRGVCRNIAASTKRWALNFDGVGVRGQLANRAINPDGDNTFVFWSPDASAMSQVVISQNISNIISEREFQLYDNASGSLEIIFGGQVTTFCSRAQGYEPNKKYWLKLVGSTFSLAKDNELNVIRSGTLVKGAAREPLSLTVIGARTAGAVGTYSIFSKGIQRDIKINGKLYPMRDYNQAIQLPLPTGLGAELITQYVLENPFGKGTQWTYLGDGRWQYIGDGNLNVLEFITQGSQPSSGYVEFEIESITSGGSLSCTNSNIGGSVFNSAGKCRYYYLDINSPTAFASKINFKRAVFGQAFSCIIKNISFKPLGTCNPMTISNATSTNWVEVPA